jgi:hypothetical protein
VVGAARKGTDLFERCRSNSPSDPHTTWKGKEIIYCRTVERKNYCGVAAEPDFPEIVDRSVERAEHQSAHHLALLLENWTDKIKHWYSVRPHADLHSVAKKEGMLSTSVF